MAQVVFTPKDLVDRQVVEAYLAANADDKAGRLSGPFENAAVLAVHLNDQARRVSPKAKRPKR